MKRESEARFTMASAFCPHPEYWTSADPDSTEFEVLDMVAGLVRGLQPELVIETGSAFGYGSKAIAMALFQNGHGHLHSFEVDSQRVQSARGQVTGLPATIHHQSSLEYEPEGQIGFAFFDSLLHLRVREFLHYRKWMEPGTIVAFHDTAPHHGLHEGLRQLESEGMLSIIRFRTPRGITLGEVL